MSARAGSAGAGSAGAGAERLGPWQQGWRLLAAAAIGAVSWLSTAAQLPEGTTGDAVDWLITGDPIVGVVCLVVVAWRRRYPISIAVVVVVISTFSTLGSGAALLAICSLATRRRPVETGVVALACLVSAVTASGFYPQRDGPAPLWLTIAIATLVIGIAVAVGFAVGARRQELRSLRQRAEIAEREQAARATEARITERHRIAREMHDVLAHRVSLVAMQAGVLGYRHDLPAEQVSALARGVADGAHQALEELRDVLGVLRANPEDPEPPQPSLAGVPALVADARAIGLDVTLEGSAVHGFALDGSAGEPPDLMARTAYRIVQEGLTNAGKHAPGARVRVTVDGAAGTGLHVAVRDSGGSQAFRPPPESGFGLVGLAERVALTGGELLHGPAAGGGFALTARLPWPARPAGADT
ncbi:sensor histidine kinase [Pseudonocardia sp. TRM90224]|uniref:sensor histidine kinase n=1 Tax=Pseudonocardia sp. TRM90224 TaxID=2812678 RepID=UPI001E296842|nr:histidine kinase [Pseudonocardia sp. TRM90224]